MGFTPYPDVDDLLRTLWSGIEAALGPHVVGMYVHGSLALGAFDPLRSDIDFLAVTRGELPPDRVAALATMHAALTGSANHEGSYIPLHALRRYDPSDCVHPALRSDGSFGLDRHGSEWVIQRHLVREHGIVLAGPDPRALIDPIEPDDLRRAEVGLLREWWAPQVDQPFRLQSSEYKAYAILTMCRALYMFHSGAVVSKPVAARWAQARLGEPWASLVESALAWRRGTELHCLDEALNFIRYTLDRCL